MEVEVEVEVKLGITSGAKTLGATHVLVSQ